MIFSAQARDAKAEVLMEDIIQEVVIEPEVAAQTRDVISEVCDAFNDKRRRRDVRLVQRDVGEKLLDGLCLDYLLLLSVKQGRIWTENEHVTKLLDGKLHME